MAKKLTNKPKKRSLVVTAIVIATLLIAWLGYNWFIHYQDRQKFMTLRTDMLALQTEFNKIDPGWQYSESCHAKGEKFKESEASSCQLSLDYEMAINRDSYDYNKMRKIYYGVLDKAATSFKDDETSYKDYSYVVVYNNSFAFRSDQSTRCGISIYEKDNKFKAGVTCSSSALDFYFPRSQ